MQSLTLHGVGRVTMGYGRTLFFLMLRVTRNVSVLCGIDILSRMLPVLPGVDRVTGKTPVPHGVDNYGINF